MWSKKKGVSLGNEAASLRFSFYTPKSPNQLWTLGMTPAVRKITIITIDNNNNNNNGKNDNNGNGNDNDDK